MSIDTKLYNRLCQSDNLAFEDIFSIYYPRLEQFAKAVLNGDFVAADIAQDVLIEIWKKKSNLNPETLEGYMFKATRNRCLNHLRDKKITGEKLDHLKQTCQVEELYRIDFLKDEPIPILEDELKERLESIINSLPPKCREVFILSRQQSLTNREISAQLGINIKNVERHISSALKKIRSQLEYIYPVVTVEFIIATLLSNR